MARPLRLVTPRETTTRDGRETIASNAFQRGDGWSADVTILGMEGAHPGAISHTSQPHHHLPRPSLTSPSSGVGVGSPRRRGDRPG